MVRVAQRRSSPRQFDCFTAGMVVGAARKQLRQGQSNQQHVRKCKSITVCSGNQDRASICCGRSARHALADCSKIPSRLVPRRAEEWTIGPSRFTGRGGTDDERVGANQRVQPPSGHGGRGAGGHDAGPVRADGERGRREVGQPAPLRAGAEGAPFPIKLPHPKRRKRRDV